MEKNETKLSDQAVRPLSPEKRQAILREYAILEAQYQELLAFVQSGVFVYSNVEKAEPQDVLVSQLQSWKKNNFDYYRKDLDTLSDKDEGIAQMDVQILEQEFVKQFGRIQIIYLSQANRKLADEFQVLAKEVDRKLDFLPPNPALRQRLLELKGRFQDHTTQPEIQTNKQDYNLDVFRTMMLTNNRNLKQDLADLKRIDFEISQVPPPPRPPPSMIVLPPDQKETTMLGNLFQTTTTNRALGNRFQVENVQGLIQTLERERDRFVQPGKHNYLTETQRRTYNSLVVYFNHEINRYKNELKSIANLKEGDEKKEKLEILKGAILKDTNKLYEASQNVAQEMKYGEIASVQIEIQNTMRVIEDSLVDFSKEAKTMKRTTPENRAWLDELDRLIADAREAQAAYLQLDPNDENFLRDVIPIQESFQSIEQRIMLHVRYKQLPRYPEDQLPSPPPDLIVRESFQKYQQNDVDNNDPVFQAALSSQETVHNLLKSFTQAQNVPRVTLFERRNKSIGRIQKWSTSTTNFEGLLAPPPSQRMGDMNPPKEVEKDILMTVSEPEPLPSPPQVIVESEPSLDLVKVEPPPLSPVIVEREIPIVVVPPLPPPEPMAPKKLFVEQLANYHQQQSMTQRRPLIQRFRDAFTYPRFIESNSGLYGKPQRKWIFLEDNTIVNRRYHKKSSK